MAPGPASWAARQAPNSQPDPMMEPKPVNMSATAPTSRLMDLSLNILRKLPGHPAARRFAHGKGSILHGPAARALAHVQASMLIEILAQRVANLGRQRQRVPIAVMVHPDT